MEEPENQNNKVFLPKTLRQIISPGVELKRANGHISVSNLQGLLVGHLDDFDIDLRDVPGYKVNFLVVYDKPPTADDKIVVKIANCYSLKVEVCSN